MSFGWDLCIIVENSDWRECHLMGISWCSYYSYFLFFLSFFFFSLFFWGPTTQLPNSHTETYSYL